MDIKLPHLGEGSDSGVVVSILVQPGDVLSPGQTIIELESGKAVAPIPTEQGGKVASIRVKVGDKIGAGAVILSLEGGAGAPAVEAPKAAAKTAAPAAPVPVDSKPETEEPADYDGPMAPPCSPSIRKLSRELGLDLRKIKGSELGGRIVMGDLKGYIQRLERALAQAKAAAATPAGGTTARKPAISIDFAQWGPIIKRPMSMLRQTIAQRMLESTSTVPQVTQFDEADITSLEALRKKHAAAYEARGTRLTLTSFVLKALVSTLKKHPIFNASIDDTTNEIVNKAYHHIGLAVDTENGLMVPVIRNVDHRTLLELSQDIATVAAKARDRKLTLDDMKGGTFTVSNQGGIGGGHFTPIINLPEVAILGLGRSALKPAIREGKVEARLLMPVAVTYDHRLIDGGSAARFITDLSAAITAFTDNDVKL
jgi:pyruvate dehydrogenase E2 component (dihydrolipoamide acetyltransferase)